MDTVVNNANLLALMNQIKQKRAAGENFGPQRQTKAGPVETPGWLPQAAASLPLRAPLCLLGCFCLGGAQNAAATQFNAIAHALANNVATQGADYGCRSGSNRNRGYTACQSAHTCKPTLSAATTASHSHQETRGFSTRWIKAGRVNDSNDSSLSTPAPHNASCNGAHDSLVGAAQN